ncbi:type 1 fimbrial protein [Enterobacter cloacae complex sp. P32C]|nr:fimbrial protein [Enterobacter cloacae complex sp. P32C]MBE3210333.1 type 1 fimbrial protein [Enterobacter cloacae complex sp. P32C]
MIMPAKADRDDNNVHFYGALVAEPCVIVPGDEDIRLDFGTVIDKYLYLNTRTLGLPFEIRLAECDLTLGNMVKVTFIGTENTALPGLLAINDSSKASGIGIGLETQAGKPLPLNSESDKYLLQKGNNTIALKGYVQGEPKALANRAIGYGSFSAVATFTLEYE